MIDFENHTAHEIDETLFEPLVEYLSHRDVELIITDDIEMQKINLETRKIDKATDVLSFPLEEMPGSDLLGTIVISIDHVDSVAKKLEHSREDELRLLFIHGMLHLLGFDHERDNGEMRDKEESLIIHFELPPSLIVRTEDQ